MRLMTSLLGHLRYGRRGPAGLLVDFNEMPFAGTRMYCMEVCTSRIAIVTLVGILVVGIKNKGVHFRME